MSHGTRRFKETPQALKSRREREQRRLEQYVTLTDQVLQHKLSQDFTPEALSLTNRLLSLNPEFYTIWNYRRQILVDGIFPSKSPTEINDLIATDLDLTMNALREHPKVYWIWNHRRWCLEHVPEGPEDGQVSWRKLTWSKELRVVESFLDADSRNFHAWNYRRYVLLSSYVDYSPEKDLAYTTHKIGANFSNFSAWHHRSKVYTSLWEQKTDEGDVQLVKEKELEFVKHALYTDPGDQSAWLYHRWLIGEGKDEDLLKREIESIEELLSIEPDSKWCLDTLIHYKSLLLQHRYSVEIKEECLELLSRLQILDPFRHGRYQDLVDELNLQR